MTNKNLVIFNLFISIVLIYFYYITPMDNSIYDYTTSYLIPIKLVVPDGSTLVQDFFIYDTREDNIESIIGEYFENSAAVKNEMVRQAYRQLEIFNDMIEYFKNDRKTYTVSIFFEAGGKKIRDSLKFCNFLKFEPEVLGLELAEQYRLPVTFSKYISFTIRNQIIEQMKKQYLDSIM
ncbi:hypothetical protein SLOPH_2263 [Spraguea lophii 42_110]|uniref:Uncharacterized protein n=1 Tax=Spraguea lophii (strain 42_110) TaxID=1358809 RepID=S7WAB0_SPRLO|nr:hypothetical protein SLOPH_2263 [Spraguea lophii 42_110]